MPRTDKIHNAVKNALIKDGWTITDDPYTIEYEGEQVFADLAAERPFAAERAGHKIVVEVKSFIGRSPMRDFQNALGQYLTYRRYLELKSSKRKLYPAVSERVYEEVLLEKPFQVLLTGYDVALVVVRLSTEEIVVWTS